MALPASSTVPAHSVCNLLAMLDSLGIPHPRTRRFEFHTTGTASQTARSTPGTGEDQ